MIAPPPTTFKMAVCVIQRKENHRKPLGINKVKSKVPDTLCNQDPPTHSPQEKKSLPNLPGAPWHRRPASGPAKWGLPLRPRPGKSKEPRQKTWPRCQTHKSSPAGSRDPCLKKTHTHTHTRTQTHQKNQVPHPASTQQISTA